MGRALACGVERPYGSRSTPHVEGPRTNDVLRFGYPAAVTRLQRARNDAERETAWTDFIASHSHLVLRTCRSVLRDHDEAMDAYTFVLGALREDDHRRLRAYVPDARSSFATWLIVVTRRLVLDHVRRKYGRSRSNHSARRAEAGTRRALAHLIGDAIDPDRIPAAAPAPDIALQRAELLAALRDAIASLDADDRLLLALRFADERPVRQIAKLLAMPTVFHVYRRIGLLLARLRDELERRGVERPEA